VRRDWRYIAAIAALTIVAMVRVASTHRVFSEVLDEPAHVAAGFEWLSGSYVIDASHPPAARILGALPLWLAGYPLPTTTDMFFAGNELLYHGDRYEKTLARTRLGNLLLLALAIVSTAAWARRTFSPGVAIVAAALLSTLPPVLAHAGLMTTDLVALTAMPLALLATDRFLTAPAGARKWPAIFLGLAIGFGLLAKFSFVVFFPPCALLLLLARRTRPDWKALAVAAAVTFMVVWAGYRFDWRTLRSYHGEHAVKTISIATMEPLKPFARWAATNIPLPAPAFFHGIAMVQAHNKEGHNAYLFGEVNTEGWWYYFPVIFFYKTPIPFLLLMLWGSLLIVADRDRVRIAYLLYALAIMAVAMTSGINIGVRHILPLYAPLAIVAAYGTVEIWKRSRDAFGRASLLALLAWLFIGVAVKHPDYLPWFNEAAQPNPARIAVDSNLDWGQDGLRLQRAVRELKIDHLYIDVMTNMRLETLGPVIHKFDASTPQRGWIAVSETPYSFQQAWGNYAWLSQHRPTRRVGASIRLYHLP
jgi:hypothetical protein